MASHILRRQGKKGVTWTVRYPTGKLNEDGKPATTCKTFQLKRDAEAYLTTLKDARRAGGAVVESDQPLTSFFASYLDATDVRDNTRASYQEIFNRYIEPRLGSTKLKDINPQRVQSLYTSLKKTLAPRTVRYVHSVLHSALDHAVSMKLLRTNPTKGAKLPRKVESEISFLQGDELSEFITEVQDDRYAPLFLFMLATGSRPGEARALKWEDINEKKGTVRIRRTVSDSRPYTFTAPKTAKGKRTIGLPKKTLDMLAAHKLEQREGRQLFASEWYKQNLCFATDAGEPLDRRNLNSKHLKKIFRRIADRLYPSKPEAHTRLIGCNLYSLRHTHATTLIEQGVNIATVSQRLGHKDVAITLSTYVHHTPAMEDQAVAVMEGLLA